MIFNNGVFILIKFILISILISFAFFNPASANETKNLIPAIKDLSCDNSQQCKSIGIDYQDCGKYRKYQLYSSKNNDENELIELASKIKLPKDKNIACKSSKPINTQCLKNQCIDLGNGAERLEPIHYAIKHRDIDLLKDLIKSNVDIEAKRGYVNTPLVYATYSKDIEIEIIEILIEAGADVNYQHSRPANTALINAVAHKRLDIIELLLKNKADPYKANFWGHSIDYVEKYQEKEMMELFRKYGYRIN